MPSRNLHRLRLQPHPRSPTSPPLLFLLHNHNLQQPRQLLAAPSSAWPLEGSDFLYPSVLFCSVAIANRRSIVRVACSITALWAKQPLFSRPQCCNINGAATNQIWESSLSHCSCWDVLASVLTVAETKQRLRLPHRLLPTFASNHFCSTSYYSSSPPTPHTFSTPLGNHKLPFISEEDQNNTFSTGQA